MQYWNSIKIGDKVELIPFEKKEDGEQKIYLSKIQDIEGVGVLEILMPMEKGKRRFVSNNSKHTLVIYTDVGMFQGDCIVTSRYQTGAVFLLKVKLLTNLFKRQRREFFRLKCERPLEYRIMSKQEIMLREKLRRGNFDNAQEKEDTVNNLLALAMMAEWEEGTLLDLSGGGLRAKVLKKEEDNEEKEDKQEDEEELCELMFRLNLFMEGDVEPFEVEAGIVSSSDILDESAKKELRCQFLHISNHRQEMLARYIFDEQRIQRAASKK